MPRLATLAALLTLAAAAPAFGMSGGATVAISTVPFVASNSACTGTLIAPDRVLTAAHCVTQFDTRGATVVVGADAHDFTKVPENAKVPVEGVSSLPGFKLAFPFAHKRPQNATAVNDIALMVLARPVTDIAPVRIAGPGDAALERPGRSVRLLGYGLLAATRSNPFNLPPALEGGDLTLISRARCLRAYPHAVTSELCAQDLAPGPLTQPCPGDSGGPLLADTASGLVQIGVTSWGAEVKNKACGAAHLPAVWMRVSRFHAFLTNPHPTLAPHTAALKARLRRSGAHRLTCVAPTFDGSPARLSFRWGIARFKGQLIEAIPHPLKLIAGATKRTFTTGGGRTRGKKIACRVRATNGGGKWTLFSPSVRG
jgi:secreted trypsin-like serine protease